METTYNKNLKTIFKKYGKNAQEQQLIQECAELIKAITKRDTDNFIEELADVQCLIDQFTLIYPDLFIKITEIKHKKAERQVERIKFNG